MSIEAINWALNCVSGITSTQKAILIALADRANEENKCWPSYEDICERSCANRKSVVSAIKKLEEAGLIKKTRRYSKSTVYELLISTGFGSITRSTDMGSIERPNIGHMDRSDIGTLTTIEPSKEPSYRSRFTDFWNLYPKKVAKPAAEKAFKNLTKKDQLALLDSVKGYNFGDERRYIPNPATFINQRRWEDEQETTTKADTGGLYI